MASWVLRYAACFAYLLISINYKALAGIGAFASPLVGQTLLARGWEWPRFFIISVCLSCINSVGTAYTFHTTKEEFQQEKTKALELAREEHDAFELENRTATHAQAHPEEAVPRRSSRSRSAGAKSGMCF